MSGVDCAGKHVCEPPEWPTSVEDAWTCPGCAGLHRPFRIGDEPLVARFPSVDPDALGWRRVGF